MIPDPQALQTLSVPLCDPSTPWVYLICGGIIGFAGLAFPLAVLAYRLERQIAGEDAFMASNLAAQAERPSPRP